MTFAQARAVKESKREPEPETFELAEGATFTLPAYFAWREAKSSPPKRDKKAIRLGTVIFLKEQTGGVFSVSPVKREGLKICFVPDLVRPGDTLTVRWVEPNCALATER